MARPQKDGLDYFPLDTNFDHDPDIQVLDQRFGNDGVLTLIRLWSRAYKTGEGEVDFSTEVRLKLLAKHCRVSVRRWLDITQLCVELGLFSSADYDRKRLTSSGIRRRIQKVLDERSRPRGRAKPNKTNESGELSGGETPEELRHNSGNTAGKGKESKVNESKVNLKESAALAFAPEAPVQKINGIDPAPPMPKESDANQFGHNDFITRVVTHFRSTKAGNIASGFEEGFLKTQWLKHGTDRMIWAITAYGKQYDKSLNVIENLLEVGTYKRENPLNLKPLSEFQSVQLDPNYMPMTDISKLYPKQ